MEGYVSHHCVSDEDPVSNAVRSCLESGNYLKDPKDVTRVLESLTACDGLLESFLRNPPAVLSDLTQTSNGNFYIPCHLIDLRQSLRRGYVFTGYEIAAFSFEAAKDYLNQYAVLLRVNPSSSSSGRSFGSFILFGQEMPVKGCIDKILVRPRGDSTVTKWVEEIVDEEMPDLEVGMMGLLPIQKSPVEVNVKMAGWYDDMRDKGHLHSPAWICGTVLKGVQGQGYALDCGHLSLKILSEENFDKFVGKNVCIQGERTSKGSLKVQKVDLYPSVDDGSKKMKRKSPEDMTKYRVGDRVRYRQRGVAFPQLSGRITRIRDDSIYIKWNGMSDEQKFDLEDPVSLYSMIEKI